jgi:hypothetical protein
LFLSPTAIGQDKSTTDTDEPRTKKMKNAVPTEAERNLTDKEKQKIWEEFLAERRKKELLEDIRSSGM